MTTIIGLITLAAIYFIPSIVAWNRRYRNLASVVVINVFLGWTLIGWVVALAMAFGSNRSIPATPAAADHGDAYLELQRIGTNLKRGWRSDDGPQA